MRKSRYILIQIAVIAVLAIAACTRPDHSAETKELQAEVLLWRSRLPMFFTLDQSADEGGTMN